VDSETEKEKKCKGFEKPDLFPNREIHKRKAL
jgi:hypothetical protein